MSNQLHKNFTDYQVKSLLKGCLDKEIKINHIFCVYVTLKLHHSIN